MTPAVATSVDNRLQRSKHPYYLESHIYMYYV